MIDYSGSIPAPWVARAVWLFAPEGNKFIGDQVARPLFVPEKQGTIPVVDRRDTMADGESSKRAPGAAFNRSGLRMKGVPHLCEGYGREHQVPVEHQRMYASIIDAENAGGRQVKGQLLTEREIRIASLVFNRTTFSAAPIYYDISGTAPFDTAGSDVIGAIGTYKEQFRKNSGMEPNALILGAAQMSNLIYVNTAIRALLSGIVIASPAAVAQNLAAILGIDMVLSGGGIYNSGNEADANPTVGDIWSDDYAMLARVAVTDDLEAPALARTPIWTAMGAGTDGEYAVYEEPQTKSRVVQGDMYSDEIIIDARLGLLLKID